MALSALVDDAAGRPFPDVTVDAFRAVCGPMWPVTAALRRFTAASRAAVEETKVRDGVIAPTQIVGYCGAKPASRDDVADMLAGEVADLLAGLASPYRPARVRLAS